jgi:hypothetical protein
MLAVDLLGKTVSWFTQEGVKLFTPSVLVLLTFRPARLGYGQFFLFFFRNDNKTGIGTEEYIS